MKKRFLALLSAATLLCSCGFSACEERHVHSYTETAISPTCTERGYTTFRCSCGESFDGVYVDALGHEFTEYVLDENADEEGAKTAFCDHGCGQTDTIVDMTIFKFENGAITGLTNFGKTLTSLEIPETIDGTKVEKIATLALSQVNGLTKVEIPASVTEIEAGAFYRTEISEFSVASENMAYQAYDGDLYTKSLDELVQYATGKTNTEFTVPSGIKKIVAGAFAFSKKLEKVVVTSSVEKIGDLCFEGCERVSDISLSPRIKRIGYGTFRGCVSLAAIELPQEVKEIEGSAFEGCSSLTGIVFPANLEYVGELAFYGCASLESVTFEYEGEWFLEKENYKKIFDSTELNEDVKMTARYFASDYTIYSWLKNGAGKREEGLWTGFY